MKKTQACLFLLLFLISSSAFSADLDAFAKTYFDAWVKTQSPKASVKDLENYLELLSSDVGHQHLPYDPEATRSENNKENMLEGMSFYLGAHTKYEAQLKEVIVGFNVIVIKYSTKSEGVHPQTKELVKQEYETVEVLEVENGKVGVIRKYSE